MKILIPMRVQKPRGFFHSTFTPSHAAVPLLFSLCAQWTKTTLDSSSTYSSPFFPHMTRSVPAQTWYLRQREWKCLHWFLSAWEWLSRVWCPKLPQVNVITILIILRNRIDSYNSHLVQFAQLSCDTALKIYYRNSIILNNVILELSKFVLVSWTRQKLHLSAR